MQLLLLLFSFVVFFSLLSVAELFILKKLGFDVMAHLRLLYETGKKIQVFFEAFGAIAFILVQPVLFTSLVVWAYGAVRPDFAANLRAVYAILN
ncbi:MAG: hypothetical protein A2W18_06665 [Candidatus Muproteobacteria bacterium RBG_16_60_9]|uniref:Uncharacterized protein n=1 Tax=Candidatus Muproteobacteria bacterium RBG_16_60_9 TaxID=1817755 RepID=A0A1F6VBY0_9PROT|nr:MAG: hypothetical protein A2W18_06665 [Candidatus Muproteobacteria bacterium RBG_16_60_9]